MQTVHSIAAEIVAREGGFVHDPDDPGGATNHGVTLATLRRLEGDINHDGAVTVADVRALSQAQAIDIFVEHYFHRPGLARLPQVLQAQVFDMYVNAGSNAVRILQRMLTQMGYPCVDDGQIGPRTVRAAAGAAAVSPIRLANGYAAARRDYYYALADKRPASRKYARRQDGGKGGWITRAESFMTPGARLTEAEHRARVATWA